MRGESPKPRDHKKREGREGPCLVWDRHERKKEKEGEERATVRHRNGKQLLPREKEGREKVREKERDLEDRIPQRPSD